MPVVDLNIIRTPSAARYANAFVVEMTFSHDDGAITEETEAVFPLELRADVIEFINAMYAVNQFIEANGREPDEDEEDEDDIVEAYNKWCNYSTPGIDSWPTDSNGNYYGELDQITVAYYDDTGTRFEVDQVEG